MSRKVKFHPMTEAEYKSWLPHAVEEYAKDMLKSGRFTEQEEAVAYSQKTFDEGLKDGVATKDNHVYTLIDEAQNQRVGIFWLLYRQVRDQKICFIADFEIEEPFRRQGYGRAAMTQCEQVAKAADATQIQLHVFGFNTAAQDLYTSLGYETTNLQMRKKLD